MHSGWAAVVAVSGKPPSGEVLARVRLEMTEPGIEGAAQPYHAVEGRPLADARRHVERCVRSSRALARSGLDEMVAELEGRGYGVVGLGVLGASGRALPDLAGILASHALIHAAEGELFRNVIKEAAEARSLRVSRIREKDMDAALEAAFGTRGVEALHWVNGLRKMLGPPWTQDQKLAALAGWLVLADA